MPAKEHLVERRCSACQAAWLLTKYQARYVPGRPRGLRFLQPFRSPPAQLGSFQAQLGMPEMQIGSGRDAASAGLTAMDALRTCPMCGSEQFTDRKVTKDNPASPDASRQALP